MKDGKVCVITGSSSGIGAATARLFAGRGWNVAINYSRDAALAEKVADECRALSAEAIVGEEVPEDGGVENLLHARRVFGDESRGGAGAVHERGDVGRCFRPALRERVESDLQHRRSCRVAPDRVWRVELLALAADEIERFVVGIVAKTIAAQQKSFVCFIPSTSDTRAPARSSAACTTAMMFTTCCREASSGTIPP